MKKLILTLMAGSLAAGSFAHGGGSDCFKMGSILLYGVGSYSSTHGSQTSSFASASSTSVDQPRMLNWQVSPGLGFNVADNLTVGVDFRYMGSKMTYDRKDANIPTNIAGVEDQVKTYDYGVGPFVRYSWPLGEHFFAYGQFAAHYLRGQVSTRTVTTTNNFTRDDRYKGLDASFVPAVGVMVCHSMGITFGIGGVSYDYRKYDYSNQLSAAGSSRSAKTNNFDVTFGSQFNIGVQKYFGCGHKMHGHREPMDDTRSMDAPEGDNREDNGDNGGRRRRNRKNDDE